MNTQGSLVTVCAGEKPPEDGWAASVYLAGPASWFPAALAELCRRWGDRPGDAARRLVVFVPEPRPGMTGPTGRDLRRWEIRWGDVADEVVFWLAEPNGHRTIHQWGRWRDSGRVVLGVPGGDGREYHERGIPVATTPAATIATALDRIGSGAHRCGGQRDVPLRLWRTPSFAHWLTAQERAGNRLDGGQVVEVVRAGPHGDILLWLFRPRMWVAAEGRVKSNEIVFGRPDIATMVAYRRADPLPDTTVVLVREFRSPGCAEDGYVRELPGGSANGPITVAHAVAEFTEETGLAVDVGRVRAHGSRQAAATLSPFRQHVFSVELTAGELDRLRQDSNRHGNVAETEATYPEVRRFGDLLAGGDVDWVTVGILTEVLCGETGPFPSRQETGNPLSPGRRRRHH